MLRDLSQLILYRLEPQAAQLRLQFNGSRPLAGGRHFVVDNLLPPELALRIRQAFPQSEALPLTSSFRDHQHPAKISEHVDPLLAELSVAIQVSRVAACVERIAGIEQQQHYAHLDASRLRAMTRGHFLGPHIDNSHDGARQNYCTLNLLYYLTPDWALEAGGNLELWNADVIRNETIVSRFNRLAVMEATPTSWHSVSPAKADRVHSCVSNEYFSPMSPTGRDYFNITALSTRPEQKLLLSAMAWADGRLRSAVRRLVPRALGRKDVYEGPPR